MAGSKQPHPQRLEVGRKLAEARERKGMSLMDVASAMGIKWQSVQQWEAGQTSPSPLRLHTLTGLLNLDLDQLLNTLPTEDLVAGVDDVRGAVGDIRRRLEVGEQSDAYDLVHVRLPRRRKALIEAYGRLHPEIRMKVRALIETLDQLTNPSYAEYESKLKTEAVGRLAKQKKRR